MAVTGAFLLLGKLGLDLPQPRHRPVDGCRGDKVKIMHADQVKQEVAPQVPVSNMRTTVLHKQHDSLVHLVICYKPGEKVTWHFLDAAKNLSFFYLFYKTQTSGSPMFHDVEVPEFHHLLFSFVDICELLNLLQITKHLCIKEQHF